MFMLQMKIFRRFTDNPSSLSAVGQQVHMQTPCRRSDCMVWLQGHLPLYPLLPSD